MKITISSKWLLVTVEKDSVYSSAISNFLVKNFQNCIKLPNTYILLSSKSELSKKKQLLLWITNVYKRLNPTTMPSYLKTIIKSYDLTLKLKIIDNSNKRSQSISKYTTITLKRVDESDFISLNLYPESSYVKHFIKLFFKNFKLYRNSKNELLLKLNSEDIILRVKELLNRRVILSFRVRFKYDLYIESICLAKERAKKQQESLIEIELGKSILLLESNIDDEFEIIRKRYLKLAKKYHPDSVFNESKELVDEYTKRFQDIQDAFSIVKSYRSSFS